MANISAATVKQLRDKTGAGMMDCKTALIETGGDIEQAIDWLRKKGLARAARKAGRVAAEGLIAVAATGGEAAVIELNSETDFVARNPHFQETAAEIARIALQTGGDLEKTSTRPYPGSDRTVADHLVDMVATIGENMTLRRIGYLAVSPGVVSTYVHSQVAPGLGKIGVLVALRSEGDPDKLAEFGRQLAMHVAAANPQSIGPDDLDPAAVDREREIFADQARQSGKPEEIIAKMVEGRLRKFYEEVCLLSQVFVIDGESRVEQAIKAAEKEVGAAIEVTGFVRYELGEGIERETSDFAAEVAAAASGS